MLDGQARSVTGRFRAALFGAALGGLACWIAVSNLDKLTQDGLIFWVPVTLCLLTMSVFCWCSALTVSQTAGAGVREGWRIGWIVGAVGLAIGFVGPLLVNPDGNLGPLLGILLTGPLGFVLGAIGGAVMSATRGSH